MLIDVVAHQHIHQLAVRCAPVQPAGKGQRGQPKRGNARIAGMRDGKPFPNGGGAARAFTLTHGFIVGGTVGDHAVALLKFHQGFQRRLHTGHLGMQHHAVTVQQTADSQLCLLTFPVLHTPSTLLISL